MLFKPALFVVVLMGNGKHVLPVSQSFKGGIAFVIIIIIIKNEKIRVTLCENTKMCVVGQRQRGPSASFSLVHTTCRIQVPSSSLPS